MSYLNPALLISEVSQLLATTANLLGSSQEHAPFSGSPAEGSSFSNDSMGLTGSDLNQVTLKSLQGHDVGDPHLGVSYTLGQNGFNSSASTGNPTGSKNWDDMKGQSDLLSSTDQFGGFRYSTNVTQPSGNGVTWNDEFTAQFGNGNMIDMGTTGGAPTVTIGGQAQQMQEGQSYKLNAFTTATFEDGKLTINQKQGDSNLSTTIDKNGNHLDINTQGNNVDVGGSLVKPAEDAAGGGRHAGSGAGNQLEQELLMLAMEAIQISEQALMMASNQGSFGSPFGNDFGGNDSSNPFAVGDFAGNNGLQVQPWNA